MRYPASTKNSRTKRSAAASSLPAPVGGWNARDALTSMGNADAIFLQNWFPRTTYCEVRDGSTNHVTAIPALPKSLFPWNGPTGSGKMFASTDADVYDVTTAGAVGASVASCTSGKWVWVNYSAVSATHYLILVNGIDNAKYYDGTTWTTVTGVSTPALTGVATTELTHVNLYKHRLFFLQKSKLNFWYLPIQQASGALTEFVLGSIAPRGGYTMAMATWTIDAGEGADDFAVFVTSEGEALVFRGTNPGSADSWAHEGTFFVGKPIGRKCFAKFGGDMVLLTESGVYPLSQALLSASINRSKAITDKIGKAFNEAALLYGSKFGWEITLYPAQTAMIVNIPVLEGGTHKQYVMNTISMSWCEFSAWDAEAFLVFNGQLYFATDTRVIKAWIGKTDAGSVSVVADAKTAFHYFGPSQKRFTLFRPLLMVNGSISFSLGIDVDFESGAALDTVVYTVPDEALWDVGVWDVAVWSGDIQVVKDWRTPATKLGYRASGRLKVTNRALNIQWAATDYLMDSGDIL